MVAAVVAVAVVFVTIAAAVAGYAVTTGTGANGADFLSGYIATVAGIVVGLPVALAIAGWQERNGQAAATQGRRERRTELMNILQRDLQDTLGELLGPDRQPRGHVVAPFLGSGLWETLRSSGTLGLIRDAHLLRQVSRAYDRIALTAYLERQAWELYVEGRAVIVSPGAQTPLESAVARIALQDGHTKAAIDEALARIRGTATQEGELSAR